MLGAASVLVVHARWWVLVGGAFFFFFKHIRQPEKDEGEGSPGIKL